MSSKYHVRAPSNRLEQAGTVDELIIRLAHSQANENEKRQLQEWRRESPDNERRFREVLLIARTAQRLSVQTQTRRIPASEAVRIAAERDRQRRAIWVPTVGNSPTRTFLKLAAALALILGAAALLDRAGQRSADVVAERPRFVTGAETGRSVQLPDGTLAYLGRSTLLEVIQAGVSPELRVEGRAFLAVPKEEGRRTIVHTSAGQVTVLGTRFDVRSEIGELDLLVLDGRVTIAVGGQDVEVSEGEMGIARDGALEGVVQVENPETRLTWMGNAMVFLGTPLREVFDEIEQRFDVDINLTDPALAERRVSAVFDGESFEQVMYIVCRVVDVRCTVTDTSVTVDATG
ncbi:MAG: DUF4974 domain-containing protein [Gemmatimonas sp.]|nr:DUF4974 domain-containing protein [Gemmatimonas sp.]